MMKCCPGIRFFSSMTYDSHKGMLAIQCPNVTRKTVGFVAIGNKKSSNNEFTTLDDGIIAWQTFLCIVQGVFLLPMGELSYIYHILCPEPMIGTSLSPLLEKYHNNTNMFCRIAFERQPSTSMDSAISFVYLNQIAGLQIPCWNVVPSVNIECPSNNATRFVVH